MVIASALCMGLAASADTVQKTPSRKSHHKKASEQAPLPAYTPQTLSPLPLEQMPAVPPQVAYTSGQLTIVAHNSTLGDILRAVHAQTGAELDVPSNASERVVATLGPGPARDVLATLLNGTHFNYVMLGSPSNPESVERLVLTAKTGPETATTAVAAGPIPPQSGMPQNRFQQPMNVPQAQNGDQDAAAADDNSADAADDSTDTPADEQQADQQNPGQGQAPKTPEQLLQELQRQQQQLQQQQQPGQPVQPGQPQMVYPNPPTGQAPPPEQN
jgi:hypothetical protein